MSDVDEEIKRLWRIVDMQTDALEHAFWAMVLIGVIAAVALVLAIVK